MDEVKKSYTISEILFSIIKKIFEIITHLSWVFVRMTIYYFVKLLYKIFRLTEIDIENQRSKFNKQEALTTIKHEFVFEKSDEFLTQWVYLRQLVSELCIEDEEKEELFEYILRLMAETEREAFNTTYNYMITKDLREPSFEDLVIQGIFKNKSDIEPRAKIYNPYSKNNASELRNKREQKKYENWSESEAKGIF